MRYYIEHLPMTIPMGVQSENNAEAVEFDVSDWLARDGSLSFSVWVTRPGETEAYQAANSTLKDGVLYWWPTGADTAIAGEGRVEILAVSANRRMLSGWTATSIRETTTETTTDAPVDQRPWLDQALLASEEAKAAAASAAASADQAEGVVKKEIATLTQDIARNTAPAIIPTATGEVVTISDSAHRPLAGLRLYGKTTQDGVPSPNSPVPLVNVGAGGSIGAYARGKNLLPNTVSTTVNNGITFTSNADGTIAADGTSMVDYDAYCIVGTATLSVGEKYILTGCPSGGGFGIGLDGTGIYDWGNGIEFTAETENYTAVLIVSKNKTVSGIVFSPMIRLASDTNATFESYKDGGNVVLSTPNGLPGIPVTSGGNYTDENGQQWLCDEIDFGRGVYVQMVKQFPLSQVDSWAKWSDHWYNHNYLQDSASTYNGIIGMCTHVHRDGNAIASAYMVHSDVANGQGVGIQISNAAEKWGFTGTTPEEFKAFVDAKDIKLVYACVPVETPIPASELAAYRAMMSQKPTTTVYNDSGARMAVDYIADTQRYIDGKLAAIAAATLNK